MISRLLYFNWNNVEIGVKHYAIVLIEPFQAPD